MHNIKEDRKSVYEISYLLVPNLSEDQLGTEIESINKIIDSGDSFIIMEGKPKGRIWPTRFVVKQWPVLTKNTIALISVG